jgi:Flp pilus assembly protein TadD
MTADPQATARLQYAQGQEAFERGEYRQAVSHLEEAVQWAQATTPLGGDSNLAGECLQRRRGRQQEAEALCEALSRAP